MNDVLEKKQVSLKKRLRDALLLRLAVGFFLSLRTTFRLSTRNPELRQQAEKLHPQGNFLLALWHENLFGCVAGLAYQNIVPMISLSKDGDFISEICVRLGYHPPLRGSSSRGGAEAMGGMISLLSEGRHGGMTVDGPRGPRREVKMGAIRIASRTGLPILPCTAVVRRKWILNSWDKFRLPKPFTKVELVYGEPLSIPEDITREEGVIFAQELAARLNKLEDDNP